jgi:hypothetical protein
MIGYFVYALLDPITLEKRYIGYTENPERRMQRHRWSRTKAPRDIWLAELRERGLEPLFKTLCVVATKDEAKVLEKGMIAKCRSRKIQIVNDTDGGDGVIGRKHTDEEKARIKELRAKQIMRPATEETRKRLLASWTPERKMAVSLKLKGRKHTAEARERIRLSKLGKPRSEEAKAKLSATRKAKFRTNAYAESYIRDDCGKFSKLDKKETN